MYMYLALVAHFYYRIYMNFLIKILVYMYM